MKPFLKWVGGKSQILEKVLAGFPKEMNNYFEPFTGGGSVLLGLLAARKAGYIKVHGTVYASDLNPSLIGLYSNIQTQVEAVLAELKRVGAEAARAAAGLTVNRKPASLEEALTSPESYYYWTRARFNALSAEEKRGPLGSALFLVLNKTCFRGVWREGPKGFNVPFGHYKNPGVFDEASMREASALLQGVVFRVASYEQALEGVGAGDFVYLDPPYAPVSETSFVGYTADGFDLDAHKKLFALCGQLSAKGAPMLMSNADVKLVRDAFPAPAFSTEVISCRRAIHSKDPAARANEVLIRGAPPPAP